MKKYSVTFHGETPLLIHRDNIQWGERVQQWTKKPMNKKMSIHGGV